MTLIKDLTPRALNKFKIIAFKIGMRTNSKYEEVINTFFDEANLKECDFDGKLWEIAAFFVLGVMKNSMKQRKINLWVNTDPGLDAAQIDLEINYRPIQLKYDFSKIAVAAIQEALDCSGIKVIGAKRGDDAGDIFCEILKAAGFSEEEIDREVDINPGFDAAYEVWDWFTRT